jgi:hypothetical protein
MSFCTAWLFLSEINKLKARKLHEGAYDICKGFCLGKRSELIEFREQELNEQKSRIETAKAKP